jgi:transcription antitermination factor NusA-like protein
MSTADALVEVVRKDEDGASFHRGLVIDFEEGQGVLVELSSTKEQIWLPRAAVRQERPTAAPRGFKPKPGELVEVQVVESDDDQPFWRVAEVRRERDGLLFVRFGGPRGTRHDSVDRRRVRPSYGLAAEYALPEFAKREIKVPSSGSGRGSGLSPEDYDRICTKSGVTLMTEFQERGVVVAIGTPKAVGLAEMLLELALRNSAAVASLKAEAEEARMMLPENACAHHARFRVRRSLLGFVIGKGGENVSRAKKTKGVSEIEIDKQSGEVAVHGDDAAAVERARGELEYVEHSRPLTAEDVPALIGRGGENINELKRSTKLLEINVIGNKAQQQQERRGQSVSPHAPTHPSAAPPSPLPPLPLSLSGAGAGRGLRGVSWQRGGRGRRRGRGRGGGGRGGGGGDVEAADEPSSAAGMEPPYVTLIGRKVDVDAALAEIQRQIDARLVRRPWDSAAV